MPIKFLIHLQSFHRQTSFNHCGVGLQMVTCAYYFFVFVTFIHFAIIAINKRQIPIENEWWNLISLLQTFHCKHITVISAVCIDQTITQINC